MKNYDIERYTYLAHYGVPKIKRPNSLRYKTKHHTGDPISEAIDDAKRAKKEQWVNKQTSKINKSMSNDVDSFYNRSKGESSESLRIKRLKQVRAKEVMAPLENAVDNAFKSKKKTSNKIKGITRMQMVKNAVNNNYKNRKNAFINNTFVKPALEAQKQENQAVHVVNKALKKAGSKSNPFVGRNTLDALEKKVEKAKNTAKAARRADGYLSIGVYNMPGGAKKAASKALTPIKDAPDTQPAALLTNKVMTKEGKAKAKQKEINDKLPDWYKDAKKNSASKRATEKARYRVATEGKMGVFTQINRQRDEDWEKTKNKFKKK